MATATVTTGNGTMQQAYERALARAQSEGIRVVDD
jgi:hypothetical protein